MSKVFLYKFKKANKISRKNRIRARVIGTENQPRLSVFKSNQHIYAQVINDAVGRTLVAASDFEIKEKGSLSERAKAVGMMIAKKAKDAKVVNVVFDRGGNRYHGIIKSLADGAREGGLKF